MRESDVLVTSAAMARIDELAQREFGIDGLVLMENAGRAAWGCIPDYRVGPLLFCAGPGNNGGDALVMARWAAVELGDTTEILIVTTRRDLGDAAGRQWSILEKLGYSRIIWSEEPDRCNEALARAGTIVDGLSGTGLSGTLRPDVAALVALVNDGDAPVVSIDVPSGARDGCGPGDPLVRATVTVVTGYRKQCLYTGAVRGAAGEIRQVDPGFPPVLVRRLLKTLPRVVEGDPILISPGLLPSVDRDAHKGTRGRVGVIGGARGTAGAPVLSGLGALYGGAGMVRICSGAGETGGTDPSLMIVPDSSESREELVSWADVLVVGPGWIGADEQDLLNLITLASKRKRPVVMDAHALRLLGRDHSGRARTMLGSVLHEGAIPAAVLTPHPGELAALAGVDHDEVAADPWGVLQSLGEETGATILLKDAVSILRTTSGEITVFDGRCPELGTAGSGDVLAGLIGACLGRTSDTAAAVQAAVGIHLNTGRALATSRGWFTASDLAFALGGGEVRGRGPL